MSNIVPNALTNSQTGSLIFGDYLSNPAQGSLNMNGYAITNLADGSSNEAISYNQKQRLDRQLYNQFNSGGNPSAFVPTTALSLPAGKPINPTIAYNGANDTGFSTQLITNYTDVNDPQTYYYPNQVIDIVGRMKTAGTNTAEYFWEVEPCLSLGGGSLIYTYSTKETIITRGYKDLSDNNHYIPIHFRIILQDGDQPAVNPTNLSYTFTMNHRIWRTDGSATTLHFDPLNSEDFTSTVRFIRRDASF